MSIEHDQLSGIVGVAAPSTAIADASERRAAAKIKRMHHHAIFTKDAEATRVFYEDILEMKLVLSLLDEGDIAPKSPSPFLHIFFEMGDGSMLAFFEAVPIHHAEGYEFPEMSIFDHHLSVMVEDRAAQLHFKEKLEAAGYPVFELDHGFCHSIYADDPNGVHMEISYNTDEYDDHLARAEQVARKQLTEWTATRAASKGREKIGATEVDVPASWGVKPKKVKEPA